MPPPKRRNERMGLNMAAATRQGIQSISLENFRKLNTDELPMKPITVLCGINSAGKSSFLKSALLMKQIDSEANINRGILPLNGKIVDLGTYYNLVKDHELMDESHTPNNITVRLSFPCEALKSVSIDFSGVNAVDYELCFGPDSGDMSARARMIYYKIAAKGDEDLGEIATVTVSYNEVANTYTIVGTGTKLVGLDINDFQNAQKLLDNYAKVVEEPTVRDLNLRFPDAKLLLKHYKDFCTEYADDADRKANWYSALLMWLSFETFVEPTELCEKWPTEFARLYHARFQDASLLRGELLNSSDGNMTRVRRPFAEGLTIDTSELLGVEYLEELINVFQTQIPLRTELEKIHYLGPIREFPQRYQVFRDVDAQTLGYRGENAPYVMCARQGEPIKKPWYVDDADGTFLQDDEDSTLGEEVNYWTSQMGFGEVSCTPNKDNYPGLVTAKVIRNDGEIAIRNDLTDVGFGISQVFPILVGGLEMPIGSTMFIEQPEVHLHPGMQGDLADYFIATALAGKQYVIETHSDHIINRLVRRIVEDGLDGEALGLADLVQIYFVEKGDDDETVFTQIEVDGESGIVRWPPDFFDQAAKEHCETMRKGVEKRKRSRGGEPQ